MSTRRTARIAQAVRHVVSNAVLFELRDPRIQNVTVIGVDVAPDLRTAKVRVSVLGDDKVQHRAVQGLNSAHGFLQSLIADELQLRYTPVLSFVLDQGVKNSIVVSRMLRALEEERGGSAPAADDAATDADVRDDDFEGASDESG
jgi:ribosome-binding factor A